MFRKTFIKVTDLLAGLLVKTVLEEDRDKPVFHGLLAPAVRSMTVKYLRSSERRWGRILEIGSSDGRLISILDERLEEETKLVGLDIRRDLLSYTAGQVSPRVGLLNASAFELPVKRNSFDCVLAVNLLNSIGREEDRKRIYREVARALKEGGVFICDFRNSRNPLVRMRYEWYREAHRESSLAQVLFTLELFRNEVESVGGLQLVKVMNPVRLPERWSPVLVCVFRREPGDTRTT